MADWKNQLYFGDNLDILRTYVPTASVDLIYLDPPFNSKATYNVLFAEKSGEASAAQITAFEDTWGWGRSPLRPRGHLQARPPPEKRPGPGGEPGPAPVRGRGHAHFLIPARPNAKSIC